MYEQKYRRCSNNCEDFQKTGRIFKRKYFCTHLVEYNIAPKPVEQGDICIWARNLTFRESVQKALDTPVPQKSLLDEIFGDAFPK